MTHAQSTTRFDRVFVNLKLYMKILEAREDYKVDYKIAKFISRTAYPNGVVKHYLI
jgi:hypothetical protein